MKNKPLHWLVAAVLVLAFADPVLRVLDKAGVSSIRLPPIITAIDVMVLIALVIAGLTALLQRRKP